MGQLKLPLSGDVTQQFSFWNMFNSGGQIGLLNVDLGRSGDPVLEREILDTIGTYGRQLGHIGEALAVVLRHVDRAGWPEADRLAIDLVLNEIDHIALLKRRRDLTAADRAAPG